MAILSFPDRSRKRSARGSAAVPDQSPDHLSAGQAAAALGNDVAAELLRHAHHVGFDGEPSIDDDRLADLLGLIDLGQEPTGD